MNQHFDDLNTFLALLQHNFSLIGISESGFLKHLPSTTKFELPGYSTEHTPTESSAGGVFISQIAILTIYVLTLISAYTCLNLLNLYLLKSTF